ncbi:MAG: InlB B-repeat-containing protein [Oscillospiraceae bacterium]|nr:InlB B-repeat-containing protein [Oscillospiraceae bacterium]
MNRQQKRKFHKIRKAALGLLVAGALTVNNTPFEALNEVIGDYLGVFNIKSAAYIQNINLGTDATPLTISTSGGEYTITGSSATFSITVNAGVTTNVILENATITSLAPIKIENDATLYLTLRGTNTLAANSVNAGIEVGDGSSPLAELIITADSTGTLNVTGGSDGGAGIGGSVGSTHGQITINGGTINANGGNLGGTTGEGGAGIGGGTNGDNNTITITGGTVNAKGGYRAAGIGGGGGGGAGSRGGSILISGGTVNATSGGSLAAAIGGGNNGGFGQINITGGVVTTEGEGNANGGIGNGANVSGVDGRVTLDGNAIVYTSSIKVNEPYQEELDRGILFLGVQGANVSGTVYGSVTLQSNLTIPSGRTLTAPASTSLTIPSGVTLTNNGTLASDGGLQEINYSRIINAGTITNNGTLTANYSTITNSGTITNTNDGTLTILFCTLTNNGTITNSGAFNVQSVGRVTNASTITNTGTITVNGFNSDSEDLNGIIDNTGTISNTTGTIINKGIIRGSGTITGAQPVVLASVTYLNASGTSANSPQNNSIILTSMPTASVPDMVSLGNTNEVRFFDGVWLVVRGDVTITRSLVATEGGTLNIILEDNAHLTVELSGVGADYPGIRTVNATVNIFVQSTGSSMGTITVAGNTNGAGIGGGLNNGCGTINIYGGNINATGGSDGGAGIGSGRNGSGGTVNIYGGTIIATGGGSGLAVGRGAGTGTVTVNHTGGTINGEIPTYNITYELDGGTVATANPATYSIETATITLTNPTKTGYTFTGWTGANGATPQTTVTIPIGSTGNKTYTANWTLNTYTITYNANGGSLGSVPATQTKTHGVNFSPTSEFPTRTGYIFDGWNTMANGSGNTHSAATGWQYTLNEPVTLYAQWIKVHTVTFSKTGNGTLWAEGFAGGGPVSSGDWFFTGNGIELYAEPNSGERVLSVAINGFTFTTANPPNSANDYVSFGIDVHDFRDDYMHISVWIFESDVNISVVFGNPPPPIEPEPEPDDDGSMNIEDEPGDSGVGIESADTSLGEGDKITDENGNTHTIDDLENLTLFIVETEDDLDDLVEFLTNLMGGGADSNEVIEALQALFDALESDDFDVENALIVGFDITLDYNGSNIIDLGDGTVSIKFSVPEEYRQDGMKLLFFGIHQNPDGTFEFILISEDLAVDRDGNVTVTLSKFSNYFLMAAPKAEGGRVQNVADAEPPPVIELNIPTAVNVNPPVVTGTTPPPVTGTTPPPITGTTPPPVSPAPLNPTTSEPDALVPSRVQEIIDPGSSQPDESVADDKKGANVPLVVTVSVAGAGAVGGGTAFTVRRIRLKKGL